MMFYSWVSSCSYFGEHARCFVFGTTNTPERPKFSSSRAGRARCDVRTPLTIRVVVSDTPKYAADRALGTEPRCLRLPKSRFRTLTEPSCGCFFFRAQTGADAGTVPRVLEGARTGHALAVLVAHPRTRRESGSVWVRRDRPRRHEGGSDVARARVRLSRVV